MWGVGEIPAIFPIALREPESLTVRRLRDVGRDDPRVVTNWNE